MRQFKWIEWNLQKIDAHHLSLDEVERVDALMRTERERHCQWLRRTATA